MSRRLRGVLRTARAVIHGVHGLAIVLVVFPGLDLAARRERIRWWSAKMLRVLGIGLVVEGVAPITRGLLVANHVSWLDIMAMHAVVPEARFVSKADVRAWPLVSRLVDAGGTVYLERERKRDALRVVHAVAERRRRGAQHRGRAAGDGRERLPQPEPRSLAPFQRRAQQQLEPGRARLGFGERDLLGVFPDRRVIADERVDRAVGERGADRVAVALRYSESAHAVSEAVEFVGRTTMLESLWGTACGDGVVVRLAFLPSRDSAGADRRELAALLRADIASALGIDAGTPTDRAG